MTIKRKIIPPYSEEHNEDAFLASLIANAHIYTKKPKDCMTEFWSDDAKGMQRLCDRLEEGGMEIVNRGHESVGDYVKHWAIFDDRPESVRCDDVYYERV